MALIGVFGVQLYHWISQHRSPRRHQGSYTVDYRPKLIDTIFKRQATKPEDKSHGVRAVLDRLGVRLAPLNATQTPDYLHHDLFTSLLSWPKSLRYLAFASGEMRPGLRPSWVPTFADSSQCWIRSSFFSTDDKGEGGSPRSEDTPLQTKDPMTFSNDRRELAIRGFKIGEVDWKGPSFLSIHGAYDQDHEDIYRRNIEAMCESFRTYRNLPATTDFHLSSLLTTTRPFTKSTRQFAKSGGTL
ncbi:hypothetical protein ACJ41O_009238 [Fusarium nematophilum]